MNKAYANTNTPTLRLRVTKVAESALRSGHPWLFGNSVLEQNRSGQPGELAVVYDHKDRFLALGLFDPDSPIRMRVLKLGKPETIDHDWWARRLDEALERRKDLFDQQTTGYRWINGESDGFPGLVLDRYAGTLVLKLYIGAWFPRLDEIAGLFSRRLQPERIVLRLSRNIQAIARDHFGKRDGEILRGAGLEGPVIFFETGLRFEADVLRGQKTGFFLDQRENRRKVELLAAGCRVLNTFSFSGGFSLYAARGGGRSVTDLDLSAHALASAERNFLLNRAIPAIASCRHDLVQADAFEWLGDNSDKKFDLIVLDPPSLAKKESERAGALSAYGRLASMALKLLSPGGILVACSCSAHVTADEFSQAVRTSISGSGRRFEELHKSGHAPDHPARFKEAEYLKTILFKCAR